ncbi:SET and MYND domain-containing protein 4-like [Chironomus tepperi]|uniref:SET and MYND domain-containing protein 4-like n=1 Tax=Chironomus tepperi TaxID=113505 RepID=UPI00391F2F2A
MKSNKIAEILRNEGNSSYKDRNFHDALIKYNESLCHGEIDSEHLGLAYANRSAICLELKKIDKCLKNIKLARQHNYPKSSLEVLDTREKKCLELRKKHKGSDGKKFFRLSYKPNKSIPYVIDGLELRSNDKYGRHIVTNKDLHVGDIVAIEKPFCSILLTQSNFVDVDKSNKFLRCAYCLKSNRFELVPCQECCSVMFCDSCYQEAFESFHKYECPVMDKLLSSGSVHIALRIFFIAYSAFKGSIKALQTFMTEIDKMDKDFSIFDFNISQSDSIKSYLRYLNTLSRSENKFSTAQHEETLENHPELKDIYGSNKDFIKEFLQRQCQTNDHYFHGIFGQKVSCNDSRTYQDLQQSIGSGWYPFCSLINHSCASNIMRIYIDGKVVLIVSRFIPSGSQLFDCYKVSFAKHSRAERQSKLLKDFNFKCDCEACEFNYPMPPHIPIKNTKLIKLAKKIEDECSQMQNINGKSFHECCKQMDINHKDFPSLELVWLQKSFAYLLLLQARFESENN